MGKSLEEQHKEVEAQMHLAKAAGIDTSKVSIDTGERKKHTTLTLGDLEISWSPEGQAVFEALVETVKLGLEARKKGPAVQVAGAAAGAVKTA